MWREEQLGVEFLLDLRGVTMGQQSVRFGVASQAREMQSVTRGPTGARGSAEGVHDNAVALNEFGVEEGTRARMLAVG